jgi:hypothetical protein
LTGRAYIHGMSLHRIVPVIRRFALNVRWALIALAVALALALAVRWANAAPPAPAGPTVPTLPAVNLTVEVRVIDEAQAAGRASVTLSTRPLAADAPEILQLQLSNGQPGALRLGRRLPVQWVQAAARGAEPAASGAAGGAVVQALTWVPSGHGLWVLPRWPGGDQPVELDLRFDSLTISPTLPAATSPSGTPLPTQRSREVGALLSVPLGVWTTFAATGTPASAGGGYTVSTQALSDRGRQLMQVRVSTP